MNLFVLSLALGTAFGDERLDEKPWKLGSFLGSVESISLDKSTSVPGLTDNNTLYLEANVPDSDRSWYFTVSTSSAVISVSDEFVKSNNLKVNIKNQNLIPFPSDYGVGGQIKTVTIPTLKIGEMTLNNVQAMVASSKGKFDSSAGNMHIGLGSLDVAYTISPSAGTISFAPSEQGNAIVQKTGTALPYENTGWAQVRYGKKKKIAAARNLLITTKISNVDTLTAIEAGSQNKSSIAWDTASENKKRFSKGRHQLYSQISTTGLEEKGWLTQKSGYHFGSNVHNARLTRDILFDYELSVSPADQTLALKKSETTTWTSLNSAKIPYLKKQTEADEEGNEADASDWSALAKMYYAEDQYKEALEAQQKVVELAPEKCEHWQKLGMIQDHMKDTDGALKSHMEASNRFHQWWDIDLDTRLDIQKSQKQMESEDIEAKKEAQKSLSLSDQPVWHHKQSSSCYTSDRHIALLQLSKEQFDAVSKTYERLDLDAGLAIVQGNAALVQGKLDLAESAYRQAIRLEDKPSFHARLGLALYFADQGEWRFADPLFAEAFTLRSESPITSSLWFDNARSNGEDTLKKAMNLKDSYPKSSTAHFLALREASILQNQEALNTLGSDLLPLGPNPNEHTISAQVRSLVILGNIEEANTLLDAHPSFADTPAMLIAKADIAAYSGDSTMALNMLKEAAKRNPYNPAVALFLR